MNTPRMKEAWESPSRTADGFYLTTTPMSVYARSCYEEGCKLERELTTVTAQRDRLAVALQEIAEGSSCCACRGAPELASIAGEALQSLTPNDKDLARRALDSE